MPLHQVTVGGNSFIVKYYLEMIHHSFVHEDEEADEAVRTGLPISNGRQKFDFELPMPATMSSIEKWVAIGHDCVLVGSDQL